MKLRSLIANLLDSKDQGSQEFRRLFNIGVFGMETEFGLDVKSTVKTVLLDVNPNKTAQFPCDYVRYMKIGVANDRGEFVTFKRNNKLTTYHSEYFNNVNSLSAIPTLPNFGINSGLNGYGYNNLLYLNYWYGGTSYNLFGIGSGTVNVGEYTIDETNKVFLFGQYFYWNQVLLEYMADGCDESGDYEVDVRMAEAVKCWLRWQDVVDRPKKASQGVIDSLERKYYNQKRLAKMRINPVIINEMQNAERRSWKLVPKA